MGEPASRAALSPTLRSCILLVVALVSLWLRPAVPQVSVPYAIHDDGLFVNLARHILAGEWLGPYDVRTLSKGAAYPLFIAAAHLIGVPLKIAEHILYLLASLAMAWSAGRLLRSEGASIAMFCALAFNPILWGSSGAHVYRDWLSMIAALALVACAARSFLADADARRPLRFRLGWLLATATVKFGDIG